MVGRAAKSAGAQHGLRGGGRACGLAGPGRVGQQPVEETCLGWRRRGRRAVDGAKRFFQFANARVGQFQRVLLHQRHLRERIARPRIALDRVANKGFGLAILLRGRFLVRGDAGKQIADQLFFVGGHGRSTFRGRKIMLRVCHGVHDKTNRGRRRQIAYDCTTLRDFAFWIV